MFKAITIIVKHVILHLIFVHQDIFFHQSVYMYINNNKSKLISQKITELNLM